MLTTMFQAFPDFHLEVEEIIAAGNHVINQCRERQFLESFGVRDEWCLWKQ